MVSEVGTTQEPKCEFGDDCGRYVDEDEVTLNKGSENTVDNSEVENPGGQGVDYSKIAESRSEQISIGNTGEYERRGNPTPPRQHNLSPTNTQNTRLGEMDEPLSQP